ncbi:MAG: ABC transporter ATP-binding protein [Candidatus Puniceispirillaceae bacterium]
MSQLSLKDIHKSFGETEVIHGVDLEVEKGEFTVFVGPSGCGKSTLLRMIAGLETVTAGDVSIDGEDVTHADPSARGVTMVFQSYALYPHMSVYENMAFALKMNRVAAAEIDRRVRAAAGILGLDELLERKPKALSGGQRQRVAIGRSIVREPKIFLFDEPLSNLDAELRVQMRLEIAKLHQDLGATMIYVTHDQVEAMTLADRIVILRDGLIEQVGAPKALYHDPDNMFVGGFIGSPRMNFLPGRIIGETKTKLEVTLDGFDDVSVKLARGRDSRKTGAAVMVGIRPEHFTAGSAVTLPVHVDLVEDLGGTSYAYVSTADGTQVTVETRDAGDLPDRGTAVISFDPDRAYLFEAATEMRL